jgi:hypothetical protein
MAIYPYTNTYVINKDAVAGAQFKAGMVLMMNADGKAVPADSQLLVFNSLGQKLAKILGLAAGDSNLTGNTIIVPDTVGNNYLDENKNFVNASNAEYVAIKRQLLDYADETINEYYNMNFSPIPKRRGIGVYSLTGDTFATDQFKAVLHGDYGVDSTDTISFSPGDLLTFGGGVNAGKLVKINTNSFGPDLVVVGIVEKYNSNIGLLYFRYILDNVSFGSTGLQLYYDTANLASYIPNNTSVTDLVTGTRNATLFNGPAYSPLASGSINFDGTDDYLGSSVNVTTVSVTNQITMNLWFMRKDGYIGVGFLLPTGFEQLDFGFDYFPGQIRLWHVSTGGTYTARQSGITTDLNAWVNITLTYNGSTYILYKNGVNVYSFALTGDIRVSRTFAFTNTWDGVRAAMLSQAQIYNRVLTPDEILNQYNFNKSRYGL